MVINSSGNVGIGTTAPAYPLDVAGQIHSSGGIVFPDGSVQTTATGQTLSANNAITQSNGNVGIGTTVPGSILDVRGVTPTLTVGDIGTNYGPNGSYSTLALIGKWFSGNPAVTDGAWIKAIHTECDSCQGYALTFTNSRTANAGNIESMRINEYGNVGIGTTNPGAKLEVDGNLQLTAGSGASLTFQDGTVQSTAWTGTACGGDYAESVDVSGDRTHYEPGDVIVIDTSAPGKFLKSVAPYSTLVSGIYSTKPGLVGRRQAGDPKSSTTEIPMAMVGIVPTKVSAENGPIRTGDLLVASATMGHAMKGTDRSQLTGAVIGKALGNLDSGTGMIEVLVTLQ
jgi:hypothetical protein